MDDVEDQNSHAYKDGRIAELETEIHRLLTKLGVVGEQWERDGKKIRGLEGTIKELVGALEKIHNMPDYDQDNEFRLRDRARQVLAKAKRAAG